MALPNTVDWNEIVPGYGGVPTPGAPGGNTWADPTDPNVIAQLAASAKAQQDANDAAAAAATRANAQGHITDDPLYQQFAANLSAQSIGDAANRRAANQKAYINFGEDAGLADGINALGLDPNSPIYQMLFGDIDANTRQQAKNMTDNGLSVTAGLSRDHSKGLQDLLDTLAARGVVRSGATNAGSGMENQRYLGAQFTARNNLLDYLAGVQGSFAGNENQRQQQLATEAGNAMDRQLKLHANDLPVPSVPTSYFGAPPGVFTSTDSYGGSAPATGSDTTFGAPPGIDWTDTNALSDSPSGYTNLLNRLNLPGT